MLYCVLGRSCAGKDYFCKKLTKKYPEKFKMVVSYTTRPKRSDETDGVEHYFVTKEEFDKIRQENEIIAYTQIGEYEYMATKKELEKSNIYIIDPKGVEYLSKNFPEIPTINFLIDGGKSNATRSENLRSDHETKYVKRSVAEKEMFDKFSMTGHYVHINNDMNNDDGYDVFDRIINLIENGN